jgi:hypothetical protein
MEFTSFSQTHVLFKKPTFIEVPGNFCRFTTIPLLRTKHPEIISDLAMWPLGGVAGAAGPIPARPVA